MRYFAVYDDERIIAAQVQNAAPAASQSVARLEVLLKVCGMPCHMTDHSWADTLALGLQADAELACKQQRYKLEAAMQAAQRRSQDLEKVNAELQVHLDSQAKAAAGETPEKGTSPGMTLV